MRNTPKAPLFPVSRKTSQTLAQRASLNGSAASDEGEAALLWNLRCGSAEIVRSALESARAALPRSFASKRPDALLVAHFGFTAAEIVGTAIDDAVNAQESGQPSAVAA